MTEGGQEVLNAIAGAKIVVRSPNGHYWEVTATDLGVPLLVDLGTEEPSGSVVGPEQSE